MIIHESFYELNCVDDVWQLAEQLRQGAMVELDPSHEREIFELFRTDYAYYAHRALHIKTKEDGIKPFSFNRAQWYLHALADWQMRTTGKVRIIIVKGRQQGLSTWTEGRAYWKSSQNPGVNALVMTHENTATANLFDMFKRYHEFCPPELQPTVGANNAKELDFTVLDSKVKVFTAKANGTGRSQTAFFFHGSEVAFWANAYEHSTGVMQGISKGNGSEVYLESTAYGNTGYFADTWELADYAWETPKPHGNGYIRCFIPWFWEPSYREPVPEGFELDSDEIEYAQLHDLDNEQMQWRRLKIGEAAGDVSKFARDYPATPEDAFNIAMDNLLIDPVLVLKARKNYINNVYDPIGPVVIGVDVAREGDDATCIAIRQGRVLIMYEQMYKKKSNEIAARIQSLANEFHARAIFVDSTGGYGGGVMDFLTEVYHRQDVTGVNFSNTATNEDRFYRIRTEMWWNLKEWLENGASVPDSSELQKDMCSPTYYFQPGTNQQRLEGKKEMKARGIKSPDIGDAVALTLAYPVSDHTYSESYEPEEA